MTVQEAFNEHLMALSQGMDVLMEGYSDEIVLITPDATVHGKPAVKEFIGKFFGALPEGWMSSFQLHKLEIAGDFVFVTWSVPPYIPFAADNFLYRDNLIIAQSFTLAVPSDGA